MKKKLIYIFASIFIFLNIYSENNKQIYNGKEIKYLLLSYRNFDFYSEDKLNLDEYTFEIGYTEDLVIIEIYETTKEQNVSDETVYILDPKGYIRKKNQFTEKVNYSANKKEIFNGQNIKYLLLAYRDFDFNADYILNLDEYKFEVEYREDEVKVYIYKDIPSMRGGDGTYYFDKDGKIIKVVYGK